jgi:hypothetical protein
LPQVFEVTDMSDEKPKPEEVQIRLVDEPDRLPEEVRTNENHGIEQTRRGIRLIDTGPQ